MSIVAWVVTATLLGSPAGDNGTTSITPGETNESESDATDSGLPDPAEEIAQEAPPEEARPSPPTRSADGPPATTLDRISPRTEVVLLPGTPPRPERTGFGLFVGAGLLAGLSVTQQVFALQLALAQDTCEDEFLSADADMDGTVDLDNNLGLVCLFGPQFVGFVRAGANVEMLGAVGLAVAGAAMRGQLHAYDHHHFGVPLRGKKRNLLIAGGVLAGVGAVGWLTTRIVLVAAPACGSLVCTTLVDAVATDVSALIGGTGAGMISYAIARERALRRYKAMQPRFSILPAGGRGLAAITVTGTF